MLLLSRCCGPEVLTVIWTSCFVAVRSFNRQHFGVELELLLLCWSDVRNP